MPGLQLGLSRALSTTYNTLQSTKRIIGLLIVGISTTQWKSYPRDLQTPLDWKSNHLADAESSLLLGDEIEVAI
jgi:hypothetical protein